MKAREWKSLADLPTSDLKRALNDLEGVLQATPDDARANLNLARLCLLLFDLQQQSSELGMPRIHIADAAVGFKSRAALEKWLSVAIGDHYRYLTRAAEHARRAVRLCPLLGDGYITLAELSFLDNLGADAKRAYIEQALQVRPFSAGVAFATGQQAVMAGDVQTAFKQFQIACAQDPYYLAQVVQAIDGQSADFFLQYFQPDLSGLRFLAAHYERLGRKDDVRKIGLRCLTLLQQRVAAEKGEAAADSWMEIQGAYVGLGEPAKALLAAQRAAALAPDYYKARRNLATVLMGEQRFGEAVEHLQWCRARYPDNEALKKELDTAQHAAALRDQDPDANRY